MIVCKIPFEFPLNVKLPDGKTYREGPIISALEVELMVKPLPILFQRPSIRYQDDIPFKGTMGVVEGFEIAEGRLLLQCSCFERPINVLGKIFFVRGGLTFILQEKTIMSIKLNGHWKFNAEAILEKVIIKSATLCVEDLDEIVRSVGGQV